MRKLTQIEEGALAFLERRGGSYCPPYDRDTINGRMIIDALNALVKKKRATVEMTDDGPRYHAIG